MIQNRKELKMILKELLDTLYPTTKINLYTTEYTYKGTIDDMKLGNYRMYGNDEVISITPEEDISLTIKCKAE